MPSEAGNSTYTQAAASPYRLQPTRRAQDYGSNRDSQVSVYIIRSKRMNAFKVGKSTNPVERVKDIRTGCPDAELMFVAGEDYESAGFERYLHRELAALSIGGEWFAFPGDADFSIVERAMSAYEETYLHSSAVEELFTVAAS